MVPWFLDKLYRSLRKETSDVHLQSQAFVNGDFPEKVILFLAIKRKVTTHAISGFYITLKGNSIVIVE